MPRKRRKATFTFSQAPEELLPPVSTNLPKNSDPAPNKRVRLLVTKDGKPHANPEFSDKICKWPIGEPDDMAYCGRQKKRGSYCDRHAALAYRGTK